MAMIFPLPDGGQIYSTLECSDLKKQWQEKNDILRANIIHKKNQICFLQYERDISVGEKLRTIQHTTGKIQSIPVPNVGCYDMSHTAINDRRMYI